MERVNLIDGLKRKYIIPCFQREYSWGEEEIEELIKNIKNTDYDDYCLGIITIQKKKDSYLLIDGQQRITTFYLIAIYCNLINNEEDVLLSSEYEELVSNKNYLIDLLAEKYDDVPQNLKNGYRIIQKNISDIDKNVIKKILKKIYYYEVDIDDSMDLNHYFEVMNSRGVQLSRSDIIKSYLMNKLENDDDKYRLNYLWYRYEKMDNKNTNIITFEQITKKMKSEYKSINQILKNKNLNKNLKAIELSNNSENDNSILNFEFFLLYVIRVYKNKDNKDYNISGEFNLNDLINEYEDLFAKKKSDDIIKFLNFMISMKNIYDKYIVKYDNDNETWSLGVKNNDMLLIQSCLRVSFINRRLMHWIYITMKYFYNNKDINEYNTMMRKYIKEKYIYNFIKDAKKSDYKTGFDTPNIVLNYLDYLIIENYKYVVSQMPEAKGLNINNFKFKFRNSIEHFKPRHDSNGNENPKWVDDFGNLALLAYGTNTKMQNAEPDEKAKHFDKELSGYSLKLQIMTKCALNSKWDEFYSYKVRNVMIKLLEEELLK